VVGSGVGNTGGSIGTYDIRNPRNLTTIQTTTLTISAPGPNPTQNLAHAHEILPDPSGRFVVVPDLGADLLRVFCISETDDELVPVSTVDVPKGSGPRHGAFVVIEGGTFFYILTQISNEVIAFRVVYSGGSEGGIRFVETQRVNALRRLDGSLIVMGPGTQNASEVHVSVSLPSIFQTLRTIGKLNSNSRILDSS
jgi:6-phosphogluconolactonase (cycloisomerase 2 family)